MSNWIMGVDPAQRVDYTGIVLVEVTRRKDVRDKWYSVETGHKIPIGYDHRMTGSQIKGLKRFLVQSSVQRFNVRISKE